jgi:hypothetical protein
MSRMMVVLPLPDGPRKQIDSPALIVSVGCSVLGYGAGLRLVLSKVKVRARVRDGYGHGLGLGLGWVTFVDAKGHIVQDKVVTARSSDGHTIEGNHGVLGRGFIV